MKKVILLGTCLLINSIPVKGDNCGTIFHAEDTAQCRSKDGKQTHDYPRTVTCAWDLSAPGGCTPCPPATYDDLKEWCKEQSDIYTQVCIMYNGHDVHCVSTAETGKEKSKASSGITFKNKASEKVRVTTSSGIPLKQGTWVQPGKSLTINITPGDQVWASKDPYPHASNIKCPKVDKGRVLSLDKNYKCARE